MIVGALASWRVGAAYLPLDTSYPLERLRFIVEDAGCEIVLFAPSAPPAVPRMARCAIPIDLEASSAEASRLDAGVGFSPDALAYVIYTSGSTGRPKGVEITQGSLLNLVSWHRRRFDVRPSDRASQVAAVGFDAAVWETWPYLAAGASLHIPADDRRSEPDAFRDWLLSECITIAFAPTPMAERLVVLPWPATVPLRFLLTGGDTLHSYPPPDLSFALVNNYGPTECTVVTTSGRVQPYDTVERRPGIGRPIDNLEVFLLDDAREPVAAGEIGEMYVGGAGVARGYRNRPELTSERFVESPFDANSRLYRTGDLARYLPDGNIAFVGRTDDQIKIRGFRIEPNEIVAALNACREVAASAVVASDLGGGDKRLVAYVVPNAGAPVSKAALDAALRASLPDYMVPAVFVRLDALPIGPHGKVDRSALPEPTPTNTLRDSDFQAPRSRVEECIADLVQGLLKIDRVSVDDNFFLLGGHSLFGTQLIARICKLFGVDMSLRDVFEAPTIAQLATRVEALVVSKLEAMTDDEAQRLLHAGDSGAPTS
jgi:amino acid adenylation domain-containing protein